MPGWRIGVIAANPTFIEWIVRVKSNIDSGTFRAIQLAAVEALSNTNDWHKEMNIDVYQSRRDIAGKIMNALNCSYDDTQVGMFLWGKVPDNALSAEEITEKVLHEAKVFITPGFIFGSNGERYIRISLCATQAMLEEALNRIQLIIK